MRLGTRWPVAMLTVVASASTWAAGGTGTYQLPWGKAGETLEYRSCGCGDRCWVAEVKDLKTRQTRARLRCDCERLFSQAGVRSAEIERSPTCKAFEPPADKQAAIRQELEQLLAK